MYTRINKKKKKQIQVQVNTDTEKKKQGKKQIRKMTLIPNKTVDIQTAEKFSFN